MFVGRIIRARGSENKREAWDVLRGAGGPDARAQPGATAPAGEVVCLKADELKMHPVEVFDVDYPWRNLTFGLQRARGGS
jgi:hypothetical protein